MHPGIGAPASGLFNFEKIYQKEFRSSSDICHPLLTLSPKIYFLEDTGRFTLSPKLAEFGGGCEGVTLPPYSSNPEKVEMEHT